MTPTLGMYSMNMNGWQGLFQQGLGTVSYTHPRANDTS